MHIVHIGSQWFVRNECNRVVSVHGTEAEAVEALPPPRAKRKRAKRKPAKAPY